MSFVQDVADGSQQINLLAVFRREGLQISDCSYFGLFEVDSQSS